MPTLKTAPPREEVPTTASRVHDLISRPEPPGPERLREAAAAIRELVSRWERFRAAHPGLMGVEISPHLTGALRALQEALAVVRPEEGR